MLPDKRPVLTEEQMEKIRSIGIALLAVVAGAGIIALAATMPNALGLAAKILDKKYPNRRFTRREKELKIAQGFYYLKRSGLVVIHPSARDLKIYLTKKGKRRFKKLNIQALTITHSKKWNGRWWQVAADIPTEKHKLGADAFRKKVKEMKFYPLQRTLWIYPFDPREEIEFLARYYGIDRFVTLMEISRLDLQDENVLDEYFRAEKIIT